MNRIKHPASARLGIARPIARGLASMAIALISATATQAHATDVGVSVSINQPGFYGRVDIGNTQPVLIYPQPVVITPGPYAVHQRPIYMRVPPGHAKDWGRYCGRYQACGQPVYFIKDGVHERERDRKSYKSHGNGKGKDKGPHR